MVQKKIKVILSQKSGISLLFVLAVLLLLMAAGISTLVAASTAIGNGNIAWEENQMEVYSDSVLKTFTANLQSNVEEDFGIAFVKFLLAEADKTVVGRDETKPYIVNVYTVDSEKEVEVTFQNVSDKINGKKDKLILKFPDGVNVSVSPEVKLSGGAGDVTLPKVSIVESFTMTVTHEATPSSTSKDSSGSSSDTTRITKQVQYRYSGATQEVIKEAGHEDKREVEYGEWEVVRFGKID